MKSYTDYEKQLYVESIEKLTKWNGEIIKSVDLDKTMIHISCTGTGTFDIYTNTYGDYEATKTHSDVDVYTVSEVVNRHTA